MLALPGREFRRENAAAHVCRRAKHIRNGVDAEQDNSSSDGTSATASTDTVAMTLAVLTNLQSGREINLDQLDQKVLDQKVSAGGG